MAKEKAGSFPLPAADTHAPTKGGVRRGAADPSSPSPVGSDLAAAASEGTFPSPAFAPTRPVVTVPTPMYATDGSGTPIIPKPIGGGGLSSCAPSVAASVSGSSIHHHPHSGVGFGASASSIGQWGGASASALAATAAGPSPQSARSVTGGRHGHLFSVSQTDGASLASASRYGSAGTRAASTATVADTGGNGGGVGGAFTTARQALAAGQASPQQSNTNGAHQQRGPDACSSSIDSGLSSSTAAAAQSAQSSAAMGDGDSFGGGGLMSPPHRDAHSPLLTSHHGRRRSPAARGAFSSSTGAEDTCRAGGGHGTAEEVLPVQQVHLSAAGALRPTASETPDRAQYAYGNGAGSNSNGASAAATTAEAGGAASTEGGGVATDALLEGRGVFQTLRARRLEMQAEEARVRENVLRAMEAKGGGTSASAGATKGNIVTASVD